MNDVSRGQLSCSFRLSPRSTSGHNCGLAHLDAGGNLAIADGDVLGQGGSVLEDHGLHMLELVEAGWLFNGIKPVCLLVPLLSAKQNIRHFCPQVNEPVGLRLGACDFNCWLLVMKLCRTAPHPRHPCSPQPLPSQWHSRKS